MCLPPFRALSPRHPGTILRIQMTVYYYLCHFLLFQLHHNPLTKYVYVPNHSTTMPTFLANICHIHIYVDLNHLVGVMTFTFSPLHCFYATMMEGGAADRRRRPILVYIYVWVFGPSAFFSLPAAGRSSCCRFRGTHGARPDPFRKFGPWPRSVARAVGVQSGKSARGGIPST